MAEFTEILRGYKERHEVQPWRVARQVASWIMMVLVSKKDRGKVRPDKLIRLPGDGKQVEELTEFDIRQAAAARLGTTLDAGKKLRNG